MGEKVHSWIPGLKPQLDAILKDWEELWGPARIHHRPSGMAVGVQQTRQQVQTHWTMHEAVIDPALRGGGRVRVQPSLSLSPQSLPSLKASGLLDVIGESSERAVGLGTPRGSWSSRGSSDISGGQPASAPAISPSGLAMPAPPGGVVQVLSGPGSAVGPGMAGSMMSSQRGSVSAPTTPSEGPGGYPARVYTQMHTHMHTQTYFVDHPHIAPPPGSAPGSAFRASPPHPPHSTSPRTQRAPRVAQPLQAPGASPAPTPGAANGNEPAVPSAQQASSLRR